MDSSDAKVSKKNGGHLEDIVQTEKSGEPMDDSRWLQESMSTEVTHKALPVDQGFSTAHDENALSTSGVDPTREKRTFGIHNHTKETQKIYVFTGCPRRY